ncbi:hypothetical protein WJ972_19210 [Achromobacter insuavis]
MPGAGLARAGIEVDVYERDARTDSRVQGYRLRIDATGQAALAHCLPPDLYALFQHSCSTHDQPGGLFDAQLRPLPQRASATWRLDGAAPPTAPPTARRCARSCCRAWGRGCISAMAAPAWTRRGCAWTACPRGPARWSWPPTACIPRCGASICRRRAAADTGTVTIFGVAPLGSLAGDALPADLRAGAGVVFGPGYALVLDAMRLPALPPLAQRIAPPAVSAISPATSTGP